ncbi:response regulator [Natronolimnohabitans innermongolicus]|uniref:Response regulator receiver protein n=1 Tax=Natronolimnohabitans innermongolicus JCM 12255 TaxID=1227499 RepID=L9WIJ4_9EURY|nr:response regulator [Natronolimnohabitans innermongolicus]ELY49197.1 response regulator receiver protein [Natronolimnohabitans innermongolicus JCM 12255]
MAVKVLIVDNSEVMREVLHEAIQDEFHVIGEAEDGQGAIEAVENFDVDVIMMDMVMPGVDGVEATRKIKQLDPSVKVIFCTSVTQQERMKPAIEAGADGYIMKPFENSTIREAIVDVTT